jgi:hypothetical protein
MPKTLTLKSRRRGAWHDAGALSNALEFLAKGKAYAKAAMWFTIAGKVQLAAEAVDARRNGAGEEAIGDVSIELSNQEAKVLGKHLFDVPGEQFGRSSATGQPAMPPIGTLDLMLKDLAGALGVALPTTNERDEEDEDEEVE